MPIAVTGVGVFMPDTCWMREPVTVTSSTSLAAFRSFLRERLRQRKR